MKKIVQFIALSLFATLLGYEAQGQAWQLVNNLPQSDFLSVKAMGPDTLIVGENKGIHISTNGGTSWQFDPISTDTVLVTQTLVYSGRLYAGTMLKGIYSRPLSGGAWTQELPNIPITRLVMFQGQLYAGTGGWGVYVKTQSGWQTKNNGLPNYSSNIDELTVDQDTLRAVGGLNGTLLTWTGSSWRENYILNGRLTPGYQVLHALSTPDALYLSANGGRIYRSNANRTNWTPDAVNLQRGIDSRIYQTTDGRQVAVVNIPLVGSYTQVRSSSSQNSPWDTPTVYISNGYTYELAFQGAKAYAATEVGFYRASLITGTVKPVSPNLVTIYPNPCQDVLQVQGVEPGTPIRVLSTNGQTIYGSLDQKGQLNLKHLSSGTYMLFVGNHGPKLLFLKIQ